MVPNAAARRSDADDEQSVAASVLTLLKGDAGQRAIVGAEHGLGAGAAGVRHRLDGAIPRADAAGRPYDAVRHIAARSLATLPPFRRDALPRNRSELLLNADGTFDADDGQPSGPRARQPARRLSRMTASVKRRLRCPTVRLPSARGVSPAS